MSAATLALAGSACVVAGMLATALATRLTERDPRWRLPLLRRGEVPLCHLCGHALSDHQSRAGCGTRDRDGFHCWCVQASLRRETPTYGYDHERKSSE